MPREAVLLALTASLNEHKNPLLRTLVTIAANYE